MNKTTPQKGWFYVRFRLRIPFIDGLTALSVRWMQPIQQQGRRLPSESSSTVRRTRLALVSSCLAFSTQQMNSFRASGVISCQTVRMFSSSTSASRKSAGSVWTVPPGNFMLLSYHLYAAYNRKKRRRYAASETPKTRPSCQRFRT